MDDSKGHKIQERDESVSSFDSLFADHVDLDPVSLIPLLHDPYDGGSFFVAFEDFGRMFDRLFPTCAFFFLSAD